MLSPPKEKGKWGGGGCVPLLCVEKKDSSSCESSLLSVGSVSVFSSRHGRLSRQLHQRSLIINFANLAFPQNYPTLRLFLSSSFLLFNSLSLCLLRTFIKKLLSLETKKIIKTSHNRIHCSFLYNLVPLTD